MKRKKPDLSQGSQSDRRLFIHEMTHVWQHQQGRFVNCEAVALFVKSGFEYNKAYAYDIDATQKFRMLNLEQQADVVEDYFALKSLPAKDAPPDRAEKIAKFERLLKPVLPLQHVATDVRKPPPPRV